MDTQIGAVPWTDLQGNFQNTASVHSVTAFEDCICFHLLLVFSKDAAEQKKYYINHPLKKPQNIPVRNFEDCVEKLYSYSAASGIDW